MAYRSIDELLVLRQRILEIVENNKPVSNTNLRVLSVDDINDYGKTFYVYRVKDSFVIPDRIHILYLHKEFSFNEEYVNRFVTEIKNAYASQIKNNKLIIPCLLPVDKYCPICSFHTSILRLLRYHILHTKIEDLIETNVQLYEILTMLNKFSVFFNEILYNVQVYYMPCIMADSVDIEKLTVVILKFNKRQIDSLLTSLTDYLREMQTSISDINSFSFRVIPIHENTTFQIIDIDERSVPEEVLVRFSELKSRLHYLDFSFLYKGRENLNLSRLVSILDNILEDIYNKVSMLL